MAYHSNVATSKWIHIWLISEQKHFSENNRKHFSTIIGESWSFLWLICISHGFYSFIHIISRCFAYNQSQCSRSVSKWSYKTCGFVQWTCENITITQSNSNIRDIKNIHDALWIWPIMLTTANYVLFSDWNLCRDPNGTKGYCKYIRQCPVILEEFIRRNREPQYVQYIRKSNANCFGIHAVVCCPIEPTISQTTEATSSHHRIQGRLLTPQEGCGFANTTHLRLGGGYISKPGESPFPGILCLIRFFYKKNNKIAQFIPDNWSITLFVLLNRCFPLGGSTWISK